VEARGARPGGRDRGAPGRPASWDGSWSRARGYALHQAALIIPYYVQANPRFAVLARRTVREVLADLSGAR
jgi:hypothetical protein